MEKVLVTIAIATYGIGIVGWLYNWWQACAFLKVKKARSFYFWFNVFFQEKFLEEGQGYRKKALIYLLVQIIPLIILILLSGK